MKKFPTHFHYYKNEDKHNPSPEEIKQQTILNNNAASSLPEELLNALDKGMENLRQQQPQQQVQSSQPQPQPQQLQQQPNGQRPNYYPEPLLQQQQRDSQEQQQQVPMATTRATQYPPQINSNNFNTNQASVPPQMRSNPQQPPQDKPAGQSIWL